MANVFVLVFILLMFDFCVAVCMENDRRDRMEGREGGW